MFLRRCAIRAKSCEVTSLRFHSLLSLSLLRFLVEVWVCVGDSSRVPIPHNSLDVVDDLPWDGSSTAARVCERIDRGVVRCELHH